MSFEPSGGAAADGDERFRKTERLRKRDQFLHTRRRGDRAEGRWVVVYAVANDVGHPRLGVTASRRVGSAVVRNRWKRRLREIFRRNKSHFGPHFDVVIIVKHGRSAPDFDALVRDVKKTVRCAIDKAGRHRGE